MAGQAGRAAKKNKNAQRAEGKRKRSLEDVEGEIVLAPPRTTRKTRPPPPLPSDTAKSHKKPKGQQSVITKEDPKTSEPTQAEAKKKKGEQEKTERSRKVVPASKEPTSTRLSETQKARLTRDNCAIWVGIPRAQTKNRAALYTQLDSHLRIQLLGLPKLEEVTRVASSYCFAIFADTPSRDAAIEKLKATRFRFNEQAIPIQAVPFGQTTSEADKVWHIPASNFPGEDLVYAITKHFAKQRVALPAFEGRKQMRHGVLDGCWVLHFAEAPKFFKRIPSIIDDTDLLVSTDPKGSCRLCGESGHTSWSCSNPNATITLSTEERHHISHQAVPVPPDTDSPHILHRSKRRRQASPSTESGTSGDESLEDQEEESVQEEAEQAPEQQEKQDTVVDAKTGRSHIKFGQK